MAQQSLTRSYRIDPTPEESAALTLFTSPPRPRLHQVILTLPLSPSVNGAYVPVARSSAGGRLVASPALRAWKETARQILAYQYRLHADEAWQGASEIGYEAICYVPRGARDLDNCLKALQDVVVTDLLQLNDNVVVEINVRRQTDARHPRVLMRVYLLARRPPRRRRGGRSHAAAATTSTHAT